MGKAEADESTGFVSRFKKMFTKEADIEQQPLAVSESVNVAVETVDQVKEISEEDAQKLIENHLAAQKKKQLSQLEAAKKMSSPQKASSDHPSMENNYVGWPRPFRDSSGIDNRQGNKLEPQMPLVWTEVENNQSGLYAEMPDVRAMRSIWESGFQVCDVCGEKVGEKIIYATVVNKQGHLTNPNGLGLHPRCALLANKFCPYFKKEEQVNREKLFMVSDHGVAVDWSDLKKEIPYSKEEILECLHAEDDDWNDRYQEINDAVFYKNDFRLVDLGMEPISIDQIKKLAAEDKRNAS
jgi:hypothetical protein